MEFVTPVGRIVQGGITLEDQIDQQTQKPKLDEQGNKIKQCFIALAIPKTDAAFNQWYAEYYQQARADFPHLFDAAGNCTHPQFAWKLQDGDGVDSTGKSVKEKTGFAGNWILKFQSQFLPKCFHLGKYDPAQQIQNPAEAIKRGYFVRIGGTARGNGVTPQDRQKKPGMYLTPSLVELVAFGDEIVGGPDASKVFGNAAPIGALPPGASTTPTVTPPMPSPGALPGMPTPGAGALPMPGGAAALPTPGALPGMPAMGVAAPAAGVPALPGSASGLPLPGAAALPLPGAPQYAMTAKAMNATREQLLAVGWDDARLINEGYMVQVS